MQRFADWYRDAEGRGYPGALVTVYESGTNNKPQLYNAGGSISSPAPISNPTFTDSNGYFAFAVPNGTYDIHLQGGGMPVTIIPNKTIGTADIGTTDAGSIASDPFADIAATNVQDALEEVDSEALHKAGIETITGVKTFSAQPSGIAASSIVNTPAGSVSSSDVQAAINELDTEKLAITAARERLTAARTYYVRTDGNDSNTGLVNSAGGAFLTIQKAIDVVSGTLDTDSYQVTIQVVDGTYAGTNTLRTCVGRLPVILQGNTTTPANCVVSTTSGMCFGYLASVNGVSGTWVITGFKLTNSGSGTHGISVDGPNLIITSAMDFGATVGKQIHAVRRGTVFISGNYSITGAAPIHWYADTLGYINCTGITVTITGTPAFSTAFAYAQRISNLYVSSCTFSGSATGVRYFSDSNSLINTGGGGATYLPGNSSGGVANQGLYL